MKRICVGVFAVSALLMASAASAQVTGSVGYTIFDDQVSLGAIQGTVGYRALVHRGPAGAGYFIPEARVGFGVSDDHFGGARVEMDNYYGFAPRYQYETDGGFYGFAQASYVNYRLKGSFLGFSESANSWEFGAGLGLGMIFTQTLGGELSYERVDSADLFNFSLRFGF